MTLEIDRAGQGELLREVTLRVDRGELLLVHAIGPVGRALVELCSGLVPADTGRVRICGHDVTALDTRDRTTFRLHHVAHAGIGSPRVDAFRTPMELLAPPSPRRGPDLRELDALRMLEEVGIHDVATVPLCELDRATTRLVDSLRALTRARDLLVLHDPVGGLAPDRRATVVDFFRREVATRRLAALLTTDELRLVLTEPGRRAMVRGGRVTEPVKA